jgi:hypothetical protein
MLSHIVMSVLQVLASLCCWVWLVLLLRILVFHPSWCELTVVRVDAVVWEWVGMVERVGFLQVMWFVMLESAMNRVLGADTPGQQVPPRVCYGTNCLLIRDVVGWVLLGDVGKDIGCDLILKLQEGLESRENLSTASGDPRSRKTVAKHD